MHSTPEIIELEQNTAEWHEWRAKGIGASEAAAVMEESPWTTSEELVEIKRGIRTVPENEAMLRGRRLEPEARRMYEQIRGIEMRPVCVVHPEYPWLRASLDGLSLDGKVILEIKCPGKWPHFNAVRKGVYPKYYKAQLMHQLLATTGAKVVHYFSYRPDDPSVAPCALVEVKPDRAYMDRLFQAELAWWTALEATKGIEEFDLTQPAE